MNERNQKFGVYCGLHTGRIILVTGDYAVFIFHSDWSFQERGFQLSFTAAPIGKYNWNVSGVSVTSEKCQAVCIYESSGNKGSPVALKTGVFYQEVKRRVEKKI